MALQLGPVIGQIGGGVEMFEPEFTPSTGGRARCATQPVGTGQWLVAAQAVRNGWSIAQLWINGNLVLDTDSLNGSASTVAVVNGPATIEIDASNISSGHAYIVRIG